MTLKDIARRVQCSQNSVSLALRDSSRISPALRRRIQEVAEAEKYVPDFAARKLRTNRSGLIGIYTQNLMEELLPMDDKNEYVLYYRNENFLGRHAHHPHVTEHLVQAPHKLIWDQVKIPAAARREVVGTI